MPNHLVIDCSEPHGEQIYTVPLTPAEEAERAAAGTVAAALVAEFESAQDNRRTISESFDLALTTLQQIIDTPPATLAQCVSRIVQEARILKSLIRLVDNRLDAAD